MIQTVLFDFDGTIFDTLEGITKSVQYALRRHGVEAPLEALRCFAGPPLVEKFIEVFGVSEAEAVKLVEDFRVRYVPIGVYESAPFPGLGELLDRLHAAGLTLGVATSKPQTLAELLLERAGLLARFDAVAGSLPGPGNDSKREVVLRAMRRCGAEPETTVLVGDTKYDAVGAAQCGVACIGAAWGYAAPGELEAVGVTQIAKTFDELAEILTGAAYD